MVQESVIRVASNISIAQLMGGGITFTMGENTMQGPRAIVYQQRWTSFAEDVMRSIWMYGFVAVGIRPDADYVGWPYALDMERVRVFVKRSYTRQATYIFHDANTDDDVVPDHAKVIHGLRVFEFEAPDWNGQLQSVVMQAWFSKDAINHLEAAEKTAVDQNARPVVYLENTQPPEPNAIPVFANHANTEAMEDRMGLRNVRDDISRLRAYMSNNRGAAVNGTQLDDLLTQRASTAGLVQSSALNERVRLPRGYRVARAQEAKEPTNLMPMYEAYGGIVAALFRVPHSMWAQFSGTRSNNNPDARIMYNEGQRYLKQLLAPLLTSVFREVYSEALVMAEEHVLIGKERKRLREAADEVRRLRKKRKKSSAPSDNGSDSEESEHEDLRRSHDETDDKYIQEGGISTLDLDELREMTDVQVVLPGLPPEDSLSQWHEIGLLTHEAYIDTLSKLHAIPLWFFHTHKPVIPAHIMLEHQPKPPAPSSS
jgi:hypothetical protein